jgi:hypothetical protein
MATSGERNAERRIRIRLELGGIGLLDGVTTFEHLTIDVLHARIGTEQRRQGFGIPGVPGLEEFHGSRFNLLLIRRDVRLRLWVTRLRGAY